MLPVIYKLITVLNKNASPSQIAGACALGAMVGLIPGMNLLSLVILCVLFLVNVNISMGFLAVAFFKPIGYLVDPLAHQIGLFLLAKATALKGLWTALYNIPFVPFTKFNNTVVLGNFVLGIVLFVPIFLLVKRGVVLYRERLLAKVNQWKIMQILKASKFYSMYQSYRSFRGD